MAQLLREVASQQPQPLKEVASRQPLLLDSTQLLEDITARLLALYRNHPGDT